MKLQRSAFRRGLLGIVILTLAIAGCVRAPGGEARPSTHTDPPRTTSSDRATAEKRVPSLLDAPTAISERDLKLYPVVGTFRQAPGSGPTLDFRRPFA